MSVRDQIRLERGTVWTSPARRAVETAELAFPGASLDLQPLARELDFGLLDGLSPAALSRSISTHLQAAIRCGAVRRRDWSDLTRRASALCTAIESGDPVVLVSHRYFLRAFVEQLTVGRDRDVDLAYGEVMTVLAAPGGTWVVQRSHP